MGALGAHVQRGPDLLRGQAVHRRRILADKFLERFQAAFKGLKPGDPMDEKTTLGPLSTESALVDLLKQVDGAVAKGAKVLMGGKRVDRPGSSWPRRS